MAYLYNSDWTRDELLQCVGHMDQLAGIKLVEAADGTERGSRMLAIWTGSGLGFHVLVEKGLDIAACRYKGIPVAWSSPTGAVHPAYHQPEGLGWLRSFQGGLFVTCGLDQFGSPSTDAGEELGLHGRVGNLPARAVSYRTSWIEDEYELEITGEIRQVRVFGENLVLRRRISTRLGSNRIRIEDVVTNEGFTPSPHMILYHFNFGFPLVGPHSRLLLEVDRTIPRDADAEAGLADWQNFQPPTTGFREQVFRHVPKADEHGNVRVEVDNPDLSLGVRLTYDVASLPYLFQWKMMGQGTYVLGIEPANSSGIEGRAMARQRDDLPHLAPQEHRSYSLEIDVIDRT